MTTIILGGLHREVLLTPDGDGFVIHGLYRETLISGAAGDASIAVAGLYREVLMTPPPDEPPPSGALRRWRANVN